MSREATAVPVVAPSPAPAPTPVPAKKGGGGKTLLIVGGLAAAGGIAAVAAGHGSSSSSGSQLTTTTFPGQIVVFGGERDYAVDVRGSGTLTARADWQQDGILLDMYIVNLANVSAVLADGNQTGAKEVSASLAVTPGSYRIAVTNTSGNGPQIDTNFTLTVVHP
jgi:hypothetical protein